MGNKLEPIMAGNQTVAYGFYCSGCKGNHAVYIKPFSAPNGASWNFNGNLERPTISPSISIKVSRPDGSKVMVCHLYVTNGKLSYLPDCTHELAGQVVDMEDVE